MYCLLKGACRISHVTVIHDARRVESLANISPIAMKLNTDAICHGSGTCETFPSRWQVRKQHRHAVRDSMIAKCKKLEVENNIIQTRVSELEQQVACYGCTIALQH
mmetsp:Transcript_75438/g.119109  ORF Transcript_75438/g.119109 Transcript_75438/m.119109 type:complete len:106 (-) Transcript_75438:78-395(-)